MKRFLLFSGSLYLSVRTPVDGGWHDFIQDFDTAAEAEKAGRSCVGDPELSGTWFHVVDSVTKAIVAEHHTAISGDYELPLP